MTKLPVRRGRIQVGQWRYVSLALTACQIAGALVQTASMGQAVDLRPMGQPRSLRGLKKSHEKLPIKRQLQNMPKPSGSGGGGSSSSGGGGGGGGGGSDCEKKYIGCLGYTSSQLTSAWIFPGSPPSCEYVHHAGSNAYYSGLYAGGYFNGGYSSEGSDGGDSAWAGSSYSGGNGYFSGESQGDTGGDENAAGGSSTYWGGSSYSGGSSGYFSGNGASSTETSENADSAAAGSNEWAGSSYSGASGYFNGDGSGSTGSDQYGDASGGYTSGSSGQANAGNQAAGYSDGANNNQNVDYQDDYDYSQVQQYSAEDADVVLSNEDFENVNDEEVDDQSNGNASEGQSNGNDQSNGQNGANGENQEKSQTTDQGSDDASPSYQDQYDPYTDFSIQNCDTYENLWMWDMALTCESEDSLENCKCAFAEELKSLGLLTCEQIALCPSGCQICTTCLTLMGCSVSSSDSATSPSFATSGYVYVLGATTGVVLFAVSCFLCSRGWKGGNRNDLGAHLMSKLPECPHTGAAAAAAAATAEDKAPPFVWLAPEVPPNGPVDPIRRVNADAASVDDNSTLYSYPPGDDNEQEASVALASVDDTFKQTLWTTEGVDEGDTGDDADADADYAIEAQGGREGTGIVAGNTVFLAPVSDHVWLAPVN